MASQQQHNHILSILTENDLALIAPYLAPVALPSRMVLERPNQPVEHVYFPEQGLVTVVVAAGHCEQTEAGVIGRDGVTGHSVITGDGRSPVSMYMQIGGRGLRIGADELRAQMHVSATLRNTLHRFITTFMIQTSFTALSTGKARIDKRLSRWLLMAHDRLEGNDIAVTHELLSILLGVRRPGVTEALHNLVAKNLIRMQRSSVQVVDREGLVSFAGLFYGIPEAEHERLTGWRPGANVLGTCLIP